eukprot:gene2123-2409_t
MKSNVDILIHRLKLKSLLESLQLRTDERQVMRIRRRNLWHDSLRFFKKRDANMQLSVHFIREEGADEGGLKREYFTLLVHAIVHKSSLLEGCDGRKVFTLNPMLLDSRAYYQAGRMVAAAIQHEGSGLLCLLPALFYTIAGRQELSQWAVDDIPSHEDRMKVMKDEGHAAAEPPSKKQKSLKFTPTAHTCTNIIEMPRGFLVKPLPEQEYLCNMYDLVSSHPVLE